jgi:Carboxypeptidase regulatory-like domain
MWAQFTSQIEGTVFDQSRSIVPTSTVTLENVDTGVKATAQTNSSGYYRFPTLPAGTFKVTVTASGFKAQEVTGIRLELDETRTVNLTLQIGAAASTVTVTAEAAAVELSDARVSGVIQNSQMQSMPIAGQNILSLTNLTPGVIGTTQGTGGNTFSGQSTTGLNAGGTRTEQNGYGLDGSTVGSMVRNSYDNLTPNEESIEDVHVSVNDYSAENGRMPGRLSMRSPNRGPMPTMEACSSFIRTTS